MSAPLSLDHLAVAAPTLAAGRAHVEAALGLAPGPGGRHARYATHNLLLGLGAAEYLEVIATDPEAPAPGRARWFGLDQPPAMPMLRGWVCRTRDLDALLPHLPGAPEVVSLSRGALSWRMALSRDGALPFGGCFPLVIDWGDSAHPARTLPDPGARLRHLALRHPDAAALRAALAPLLDDARVSVETGEAPELTAEIALSGGGMARLA